MARKIVRKIREALCPKCKSVMSWDSVGWGNAAGTKIEVTCWCSVCHDHRVIVIEK